MKIELIRLVVAGNAMSVALRECLDTLKQHGITQPDAELKLMDWQDTLIEYSKVNDLPNLLNPDLIRRDKRFSR